MAFAISVCLETEGEVLAPLSFIFDSFVSAGKVLHSVSSALPLIVRGHSRPLEIPAPFRGHMSISGHHDSLQQTLKRGLYEYSSSPYMRPALESGGKMPPNDADVNSLVDLSAMNSLNFRLYRTFQEG